MGVNKVIYYGEVLVDMSQVSVKPETLVEGKTALDASGELITGVNPYELTATDTEVDEQSSLLDDAIAALAGKAAGGGSGGIVPSGEIEITENGTYDVTQYASAVVNVAGSDDTEPDYRELYQRVDYIESVAEGTYPYIITDIIADNNTGLELIASFPILQDRVPMGSRETSGTTRFYCCYPLSATDNYYGFNSGSSLSGSFAVDTIYRCQTNFLGSRMAGIFDEDGNRKSGGLIGATLTTQTMPIAIFGYNYAVTGEVSSKREYLLYGARISQGFEVVREYVPCRRKADGVCGLYEKITGQFLTNANDSAVDFGCGDDIEWEV